MLRDSDEPREVMMKVLHGILGGGEVKHIKPDRRIPRCYRLAERPIAFIAGDNTMPLDHHLLPILAELEECDVLASYIDQHRAGHPFLFDIVLQRASGTKRYASYVFCLGSADRFMLVPQDGQGPQLWFVQGRMEEVATAKRLNNAARTFGVIRGQVSLCEWIYGGGLPISDMDEPAGLKDHPDRLGVIFPIYDSKDYIKELASIDDALMVHRDNDGRFSFALRPLHRFKARNYGAWLIDFARDLRAEYTMVVIDRDIFIPAIIDCARRHAAASQRAAIEEAVEIIGEHQSCILDHLDSDDKSFSAGRAIIAGRERRTKADPGESDSFSCVDGLPTPRSEQIWNTFVAEWCDPRMAQHGQVAWKDWIHNHRPDMLALAMSH